MDAIISVFYKHIVQFDHQYTLRILLSDECCKGDEMKEATQHLAQLHKTS